MEKKNHNSKLIQLIAAHVRVLSAEQTEKLHVWQNPGRISGTKRFRFLITLRWSSLELDGLRFPAGRACTQLAHISSECQYGRLDNFHKCFITYRASGALIFLVDVYLKQRIFCSSVTSTFKDQFFVASHAVASWLLLGTVWPEVQHHGNDPLAHDVDASLPRAGNTSLIGMSQIRLPSRVPGPDSQTESPKWTPIKRLESRLTSPKSFIWSSVLNKP